MTASLGSVIAATLLSVGCDAAKAPCERDAVAVHVPVPAPEGSLSGIRTRSTATEIRVLWTSARLDVDHYEILKSPWFPSPQPLATLPADAREYVDGDVVPGVVYFYWVAEVYSDGTRSPSFDTSIRAAENARYAVSATPEDVSSPTFRALGRDGFATVEILGEPDPAVAGYHVWIGRWGETPLGGVPGVTEGLTLAATLEAPATQISVTGLSKYERYFLRVTAFTQTAESSLSAANQQSVFPSEVSADGPPPSPGDASVSSESGHHVRVSWSPGFSGHVHDLATYRVYRLAQGVDAAPTLAGETTATSLVLAADGGKEISFCVHAVDRDGNESAAKVAPTFRVPPVALNEKVLVVYNGAAGDGDGDGVNDSEEVANHYARLRQLPPGHVLAVFPSVSRYYGPLDWARAKQEILDPIRQRILELGVENVYYVAMAYGLPLYLDNSNFLFKRSLDRFVARVLDVPEVMPSNAVQELAGTVRFSVTAGGNLEGPFIPFLFHVQDLPLSVNDFRSPHPEFTSLFDHSFRRSGFVNPASDNHLFLVTRLDGFDARHAKELVDRALYAERFLSPEAGHYHGDAYLDRGSPITLTPVIGDFNFDGDSDEAGFAGNGDDDDLSEEEIRRGYPSGLSIGAVQDLPASMATSSNAAQDFNWAWFRLFLQDRGWTVKVEGTRFSIGQAGSALVTGESVAEGPPTPVQWYVGTYNNQRAFDRIRWAVGAVGSEFSSYGFKHPKDPKSTVPNWTGELIDDSPYNQGVGANFLYRGITAFSGAVEEPGYVGAPRGDVLVGYLLEGFPFADAAARMRIGFNAASTMDFGDPLYRPFWPGRVAALDTTAPPLPDVEIREETLADGIPRYGLRWSLDGLSPEPELAVARLEYGPTESLGNVLDPEDARLDVPHIEGRFDLEGLVPGETVHYRLTLRDPSGNVSSTPVASFVVRDPAADRVVNGGFERDADGDGIPDGWTVSGSPRFLGDSLVRDGDLEEPVEGVPQGFTLNDGILVCDGTASHAGLCAARTGAQPLVWTNPGRALYETGQEFRLRVYARRETANPGRVRVRLVWKAPEGYGRPDLLQTVGTLGDPENAGREELTSPWDLPEGDWGLFEIRGRVPDASLGLDRIELLPVENEGSDPVWYDGLALTVENPNAFGGRGAVGVRGDSDTFRQRIVTEAGRTSTLRARLRRERGSSGAAEPRVRVSWKREDDSLIEEATLPVASVVTQRWASFEASLVAPQEATALEVELLGTADPGEWIHLDDVTLTE